MAILQRKWEEGKDRVGDGGGNVGRENLGGWGGCGVIYTAVLLLQCTFRVHPQKL